MSSTCFVGWAQVLAFFLVFLGLTRFLVKFLEVAHLVVMATIPAAIIAVVEIVTRLPMNNYATGSVCIFA